MRYQTEAERKAMTGPIASWRDATMRVAIRHCRQPKRMRASRPFLAWRRATLNSRRVSSDRYWPETCKTASAVMTFPHHRLDAFQVALDFVRLIKDVPIADSEMRKHARGSAGACARNLAEGAGRRSAADKARAYSIARGELCEAIASVEIDEALGGCTSEHLSAVRSTGARLDAMLRSLTGEAGRKR